MLFKQMSNEKYVPLTVEEYWTNARGKFLLGLKAKYVKKNDYCQKSSGHIIPFGDSQDIILFRCFIVT